MKTSPLKFVAIAEAKQNSLEMRLHARPNQALHEAYQALLNEGKITEHPGWIVTSNKVLTEQERKTVRIYMAEKLSIRRNRRKTNEI